MEGYISRGRSTVGCEKHLRAALLVVDLRVVDMCTVYR